MLQQEVLTSAAFMTEATLRDMLSLSKYCNSLDKMVEAFDDAKYLI